MQIYAPRLVCLKLIMSKYKTERRCRERSWSKQKEQEEKHQRLNTNHHIELDYDALEYCNNFMEMYIDINYYNSCMYHHVPTMLTFRFTKAYVMTNMLPNKSTCDIGIFLLRISNLFNLPITCST